MSAHLILARTVSERDFQASVMAQARALGWRSFHARAARTADNNWRTPVSGDGRGFPDLVLLRLARLVVAELKSEVGVLESAQHDWLDAWRAIPGCEVHVWRPRDADEIERILA